MSSDELDPPISQGNASQAESSSPLPAPIPGPNDHGDIPLTTGGRRIGIEGPG